MSSSGVLADLYEDVVALYRGWHDLETGGRYGDGHPVVDQDHSTSVRRDTFASRRDVLTALDRVRRELEAHPSHHPVVVDNLAASQVFLRALAGERLDFGGYVAALYAYVPAQIPSEVLDATTAQVASLCSSFGFSYRPADKSAYHGRFRIDSSDEVVALTEAGVEHWLGMLYAHIEPPELLEVGIRVVEQDEPWSFFLSSPAAGAAVLSVNVHPRHTFTRGQCKYIASHEIAGHAVQHATWAEAVTRQGLPDALHVHATHHPVAALAEGIAQTLPYFLCGGSSLEPELLLAKKLRELRDLTLANAQLMLERGAPIAHAWSYCADRLFFVEPFEIERDLTSRSTKPAERAYQHCYAPSLLAYLDLADRLPPDEVGAFLRSQYWHIPSARDFWSRREAP